MKDRIKDTLIEIKVLPSNEIDQAIDCFARAIARDWPNTKEEAARWVFDEFHHPGSVIFGAFYESKIIGVCSLVLLDFILDKLTKSEHGLISNALQELKINLSKAIYIGGFSVEKKYETRLLATRLFTFAENYAKSRRYETLVAYTARPSEKYQKIKALQIALSRAQMKELPLSHKIFHLSPADLEKVWLYKFLKQYGEQYLNKSTRSH